MQRKGLIKLGDVLWQKTVLHYENDLPSIPAKVERLFVCIRYVELYGKDCTTQQARLAKWRLVAKWMIDVVLETGNCCFIQGEWDDASFKIHYTCEEYNH